MFSSIVKNFLFFPLTNSNSAGNYCFRTAKHSLFKNKRLFSFNNTSIPPIYSLKTKVPSQILSVFVCQTRELARMSAVIEPRPVHCVRDVPQLCALQLWDRQIHVRLIVLPMNCKLIVHFWYTIILHTLMVLQE